MDEVAGSSPAPPTSPHLARVFSTSRRSEDAPKGCVHLPDAVEAFLLSRRVGNVSPHTLSKYTRNLTRFMVNTPGAQTLERVTPLAVQKYLASLRPTLKTPSSIHTTFATLRTFFTWAVEADLVPAHPMRGLTMKVPKTLPYVPENDHIRGLLAACPNTFEGVRNRALVALLADSGLRISEALRVRVEDVSFSARTLTIREGKGGKDGTGFFGVEAARLLRAWLARRPNLHVEEFLFCDRAGCPLTRRNALAILHRLSKRAGLPRKLSPHRLRNYAATSILRRTGDLELVRQVLRHETLAMALRYARLTQTDTVAKFRRASPLDDLRAGQ